MYLRCSFINDTLFCSTSEDGFLCVWNVNSPHPIQKIQISKFVINDVSVSPVFSSNWQSQKRGRGVSIENPGLHRGGMRLERKAVSERTSERITTEIEGEDGDLEGCVKYQIAVACDEFVVKIY